MKQVTDIAIFKLKDGSNKEVLIQEWTNFLASNYGFISRQLFCSAKDENIMMDIIVWSSSDDGDKAFSKMNESPAFAEIKSMIESITIAERFLTL